MVKMSTCRNDVLNSVTWSMTIRSGSQLDPQHPAGAQVYDDVPHFEFKTFLVTQSSWRGRGRDERKENFGNLRRESVVTHIRPAKDPEQDYTVVILNEIEEQRRLAKALTPRP
jgi:hypothetical protein